MKYLKAGDKLKPGDQVRQKDITHGTLKERKLFSHYEETTGKAIYKDVDGMVPGPWQNTNLAGHKILPIDLSIFDYRRGR